MEDIKQLYSLGLPISTPIGDIHFLTVREYPLLTKFMPYIELQKFEIIDFFKSKDNVTARFFSERPFVIMIKSLENKFELFDMYTALFELCFKEDVFYKIETDEDFEYYRALIRQMNCIPHEEKNPNPEIQYFNDLKKTYNSQKGEGITFESIFTSVWLKLGVCPLDLTIYQLHALFNRIAQEKNHETSVLYSTVASDVTVEAWYKHIDMFETDKRETTTMESLQKQQYDNLGVKKISN